MPVTLKRRIAVIVVGTMIAVAGALAASATSPPIDDAQAKAGGVVAEPEE